jgi:hypothetical protein
MKPVSNKNLPFNQPPNADTIAYTSKMFLLSKSLGQSIQHPQI